MDQELSTHVRLASRQLADTRSNDRWEDVVVAIFKYVVISYLFCSLFT